MILQCRAHDRTVVAHCCSTLSWVAHILLQVCPDSAKVQLNSGILARRSADWGGALAHFERAKAIEPTYCEPDFWSGLTLLNANRCVALWAGASETCWTGQWLGLEHSSVGSAQLCSITQVIYVCIARRTAEGLARLETAIDCPYVASKSLQALNQAYVFMHARNRQGVTYMQVPQARSCIKQGLTWGGILDHWLACRVHALIARQPEVLACWWIRVGLAFWQKPIARQRHARCMSSSLAWH